MSNTSIILFRELGGTELVIRGARYQLISGVGSTPTSRVWRAMDLKSKNGQELVAIKELRMNESSDMGVRELFRRECESLGRLHHSSIISYLDSGSEKDILYIVMELFESKNLALFRKDNNLDYYSILKIAQGITEGIAHAHDSNVIHRDIKPGNILINDVGTIKIIDFGISKIIGYIYSAIDTVKDYMTPAYASPEQLMHSEIRQTTDLFSLGAIFYFLVTSCDPPENKEEFLEKVDSLVLCPEEFRELIKNLVRINPSQRLQNAHQVLKEIKRLLSLTQKQTNIFHLVMSNSIPRQMFEVGLIDYNLTDTAMKYIKEDIDSSAIYKSKKNYYIIGKQSKYQCRFSSEKNYLYILRVHSLDYIEWERERDRGIEVNAKWNIVRNGNHLSENTQLDDFLSQTEVEEQKRQVRIKREESQNNLLSKWERVIDEEAVQINKKKAICNYSSFDISDDGYSLIVHIDRGDWGFQVDDYVQMNAISGNQISVGTISDFNEDTIIIVLNGEVDTENIGRKGIIGIDLQQYEVNIKRLRRAVRTIRTRTAINPNLPDILLDPSVINNYSDTPVGHFFQDLDESNRLAVEKALSTKDMFLIQGPPGTGKTTVITEIICQILESNPKSRILLASQSHVAVDHALIGVSQYLKKPVTIRIGRLEKISEDSMDFLMSNQIKKWIEVIRSKSITEAKKFLISEFNLTAEGEKYIYDIFDGRINCDTISSERITNNGNDSEVRKLLKLLHEWYRRLGKSDEFDEIFSRRASIVASTCMGIASRHALNDIVFDWVIVDEAGRATAPELLVPIVRGRRIILVGDHKQLPPVVDSSINSAILDKLDIRQHELEISLFEELFEKSASEAKIVLSAQFRMHPAIAQLISDVFYSCENIVSKVKIEERKHYLPWWPKSIVWFDTQRLKKPLEQECKPSKRNHSEADLVLRILQQIEKQYSCIKKKVTVAVISGYSAQKHLLLNLIAPHDSERWKFIKISIDNVDAFQGSEADIVIYSVVRNNKELNLGFLNDYRRLNVALSRGRNCLIIVGNVNFAERANSDIGSNPFINVLTFIRRHPEHCAIEDAKVYFGLEGEV
jgi:serine/threonine-protein kinase